MKSRNALLGLSLLLAMPLAAQEKNYVSEVWVADQGNGKYKNPILYADYSDPDACRVGDDFYMTSSSFNCLPGLQILHSKDLVNWSIIGAAVLRPPLSKHRNVRSMATVYGRLPSAIITVNSTFLGRPRPRRVHGKSQRPQRPVDRTRARKTGQGHHRHLPFLG